jgi:hypothetical protein
MVSWLGMGNSGIFGPAQHTRTREQSVIVHLGDVVAGARVHTGF